MSAETPPSFVASGVGVAAGSGVAVGVDVASELHAAMTAAVAKSVIKSNALLRTEGQAMSGNSSSQPAKRSAFRIGVPKTPVEAPEPRRPPQLHPSGRRDTPVAVDLLPLGRRARSSCTRTTALPAMVRSQWPPRALWPSGFRQRSATNGPGLSRSMTREVVWKCFSRQNRGATVTALPRRRLDELLRLDVCELPEAFSAEVTAATLALLPGEHAEEPLLPAATSTGCHEGSTPCGP